MSYTNGYADEYDLEGEIDYSDIEQKYAVHEEDALASTIVIDGAPIVGDDRRGKLLGAIRKWAEARGFSLNEDQIEMPSGSDGKSKGFFFVTFANPAIAEDAAKKLTADFDRKHSFTCVPLSAIPALQEMSEEFEEPSEQEPFKPKEHLKGWLTDPQARDQMVVVCGDDVQVVWNHKGNKHEIDHERKKWTEKYCLWSPSGTILTTLHAQGVGLWGGNSFSRIHRFPHAGVNFIDFSPFENYMVTLSPIPIEASRNPSQSSPFTDEDEGHHIAVWEVATGTLLRTFPMIQDSPNKDSDDMPQQKKVFTWPILKWSGDEKYAARVTPGQMISVYETPSMGLVDRKSIKIDGVVDFEWAPLNEKELNDVEEEMRGAPLQQTEEASDAVQKKPDGKKKQQPKENVLAFWQPEGANQPARVSLMGFPSRSNLRTKNLFNVAECKLHWQDQGDFLCVKVDRFTKTKKATYCNLEIFRAREKAIPIQVVEIKDTVTAFAWEPKGDRFALITSNDPVLGSEVLGATVKTSINFFQLDPRKGDFIATKSFDQKSCNRIFWSPRGRHVIFATLGSTSKFDLEFWDVELDKESKQQGADTVISTTAPTGSGITLLTAFEHYGMTSVDWDPSGRFVAAVGSIWLGSIEPGFSIYDFKGNELLKRSPVDKFKQLIWRPRPRSLLSSADQRKIRKNLRDYARQFDEVDQLEEMNVSSELQAQRKRLVDEWNAWRQRTRKAIEEEIRTSGRVQKALEVKEQAATATVEEYVEEIVEETEEVVVD